MRKNAKKNTQCLFKAVKSATLLQCLYYNCALPSDGRDHLVTSKQYVGTVQWAQGFCPNWEKGLKSV